MKIALMIVSGPKEAKAVSEIVYITQNILEKGMSVDFYILDDCTCEENYQILCDLVDCNVYLFRNKTPNGYYGMPKSLGLLIREVGKKGLYDLVIKMDPDGLILDSRYFYDCNTLFETFGKGIIAPFKISASGSPRVNHGHVRDIALDILPFGLKKTKRKGQKGFRFKPPSYIKILPAALIRNYRIGQHVLGGVCAISGDTLVKIANLKIFRKIDEYEGGLMAADDVLITICTFAVGHKVHGIYEYENLSKTVLKYKPPLNISVEEIVQHGISAIHPIKGDEGNYIRSEYIKYLKNANT